MERSTMLDRVAGHDGAFDVVVVGGGATGLGVAVDAASRGYSVALFERTDFGQATSSRSTKLVHGGVRYLRQGNVGLVVEALRERALLLRNAPHLAHPLEFVVPSYAWWESPYYGLGLGVYGLLAGRRSLGRSRHVGRDRVLELLPTLRADGLRGGTTYFDGQFDDARLALALARTAADLGAVVLNHAPVTGLRKEADGRITGVVVEDFEGGRELSVEARAVVNATGAFVDAVRRLDDPGAEPMVTPSQGAHVVVDHDWLPGRAALMVPRTDDGRVLFAIPWHGVTVVGTTDVAVDAVPDEPRPMAEEVDFILDTANRYLARGGRGIGRGDLRSVFAGIRPLVRAPSGGSTSRLARDHVVHVDATSGLVTVTGGKWTTYRQIAEDVVDRTAAVAGLGRRPCRTRSMPLHGAVRPADEQGDGAAPAGSAVDPAADPLAVYGTDAEAVRRLADEAAAAGAEEPVLVARTRFAARHEMARTVDDVLSRRTRTLVLDARRALALAPLVATVLAEEAGRAGDRDWIRGRIEAFGPAAAAALPDADDAPPPPG